MRKPISKIVLVPIYLTILVLFVSVAYLGNEAVTVISHQAPLEDRNVVIIDAGHGGIDGGATSCTGVLESDINLEISLRLNDLMHLLGIDTIMIRSIDESIHTQGQTIAAIKVSDLKNRVRIVNDQENAVLISVHQNYFEDGRYAGAQVFYANSEDSVRFAKELQADFVKFLNPGNHRKAKKADGVYLMQHIQCPGVLIECGFLSNPEEEAKLRNSNYQKNLCSVIAAQTSRYLSSKATA